MRPGTTIYLLSLASGAVDAASFLKFSVFTSAMSGNAILLGIAVGQARLPLAINAGLAFAGYFLGAIAGTLLRNPRHSPRRSLLLQLLLEAVFLAGFLLLWPRAPLAHAAIACAAVAMGLQASAAHLLRMSGVITVVFTGTLTSIAEALEALLFRRSPLSTDAWHQIIAFACYAAGAILAGLLSYLGAAAAAVPLVAVLGALTLAGGGGGGRGQT